MDKKGRNLTDACVKLLETNTPCCFGRFTLNGLHLRVNKSRATLQKFNPALK